MEKANRFILWGIIGGVILGAILGGAFPEFGVSVKFIGEIFLHALMMMVVSLLVASMITGVAALGDIRKLGGIGVRTLAYFGAVMGIAVVIGLILVNVIRPGRGLTSKEELPETEWSISGNTITFEESSPAPARSL